MTHTRKYVLDEQQAAKKLERIALEIIENNVEVNEIVLAGIAENGTAIAHILQEKIASLKESISLTLLTISLDKKRPSEVLLSEQVNTEGKVIIVIDDVANSGRTMLYALQPFLPLYPYKIQTVALIERSHNSFPVKVDYVGLSLATTIQEHIQVDVESGIIKGAYLQ